MAAVASVIRNRLAAGGYGRTPSAIVHAPSQFEAWHPPSGTGPALTADSKSPAYQQAAAIAQGVFRGVVQDQTGGATHFFAPAAQASLGRSVPGWASGEPLAEFPQPIQDKGIIGSLINSVGKGNMAAGALGPAQPIRVAGAAPQTAAPALSAADYDNTPPTPADWAGTRADYIQARIRRMTH
jgi:hypothetical protein